MKRQFLTSVFAVGAVAVGTLGQIGTAEAASLGTTCSSSIAAKVTLNIGCEIGNNNNDKVGNNQPLQVNLDQIFGFGDWKFLGKDNEGLNISNDFPGSTKSGSWNISGFLPANWSNAMLVFKGGNANNTLPGNYVAYLLDTTSGTWNSPFTQTNGTTIKDVSHISLYYRPGTTAIPTPALLPGLIGMGVAALRKKQAGETSDA